MVWESFKIALDMLRLHKMRAFLTMLGVIIGVMAVSLIVLVSSAFQEYIGSEFKRIGANTIYVAYAPSRVEQGKGLGAIDQLSLDDIDFIQQRTGKVEIASGYREAGNQKVKFGEVEVSDVGVKAIDENFIELNQVPLVEGRYFTKQDSDLRSNVCLISEDVKKKLFPKGEALGKFVSMSGITLEIVGITKAQELMGRRETETLFLPLSTANSKWLGGNRVDLILMRAKPGVVVNDVMDEIWQALMLRSGNRELYRVESSENVLKLFQGLIGGAGTILSAIAALSLLVGGIGIMNIMLVSVTERTREIGLRKALGARRGVVLTQFLVESAVLSLTGGMIGMLVAYGFGLLISLITKQTGFPNENGLNAPFPWLMALVAAAVSGGIGMVFGLYPAVRASSLDPIVALRSE